MGTLIRTIRVESVLRRAKNLSILAAGETLNRIFTTVAFIHLARVLASEAYGQLELTLAVMMFLTLVVDQGLGILGTRQLAREGTRDLELSTRIISSQLILATGAFSILTVATLFLPLNSSFKMLLIGYGVALFAHPLIAGWIFQAKEQMFWVAFPLSARQGSFMVLALLLVQQPSHLWRLPLFEIASAVAAVLLTFYAFSKAGERPTIVWKGGWDRKLLAEALPVGASQLIWALRMYLPTLLVGALAGTAVVGFFGVAHRVVIAFQTLLEVYFKNLFPGMSVLGAQFPDRLRSLLHRSTVVLLLLTIILALAVNSLSATLIGLLFGQGYVRMEATTTLGWLIWLIPILAWRRHARNALIALDRQKEEFQLSLLGVGLLLISIFPLISWVGVQGAAIAMVASELVTAGLAWRKMELALSMATTGRSDIQPGSTTSNIEFIHSTAKTEKLMDEPSPIFILGAPRSGTSFLRVLLNRHPSIALCDETYYFYYIYNRRRAFGDLRNTTNRRRLIEQYIETQRIEKLNLDREALTSTLMQEGDAYDTFFLALLRFYARQHGKLRYGEKTPQHSLASTTLNAWYPNGRLIHLTRDPRDVVNSLLKMPWASQNVLANARLWAQCNAGVLHCEHEPNYLQIQYERLVQNPEEELERLCIFLGEPFAPEMLTPGTDEVAPEWWFKRASGPVSKNRINLWQQELTKSQVELVEAVAGPLMQKLGYSLAEKPVPQAVFAKERVMETLDLIGDKLSNWPRIWNYWIQPTQLDREEAWIDQR